MTDYEYTCKSALKYYGLSFLLVAIFSLISTFFGYGFVLIPIVIIAGIFHYRQKFFLWTKYIITEEGVDNRKVKLRWEDIDHYKVFSPEGFYIKGGRMYKPVFPPMICMGKINNGNLWAQSKKHCVVVPLTQRNLALIGKYYKGDNKEIREIIEKCTGWTDQYSIEWESLF